jgi:hypothetical protein
MPFYALLPAANRYLYGGVQAEQAAIETTNRGLVGGNGCN